MKKNSKYASICLLLLTSLQGHAFNCESQANGSWDTASTWVNCNGTFPKNDDNVTIKNGTNVTLTSATNNLESLFVEAGGDLIIDIGVPSQVVINSNTSMVSTIDLSNTSLLLKNDLVINANNKNLLLGVVNGGFDLLLNSSAETHLTNTIGGMIPVKSITTDSAGTTFFADPNGNINTETISADEKIEVNDTAVLAEDTTLKCPDGNISFASTINSGALKKGFAIKSSNNSSIKFYDEIGSINELFTFSIFNSIGAIVEINTSKVTTQGEQRWDMDVVLNSPTLEVLMTSTAGGKIRFGKLPGTFTVLSESTNINSLTIDTVGPVDFISNVGSNNKTLNSLFVNTPSTITLSKNIIRVADTVALQGPVVLTDNYSIEGGYLEIQGNVDNGGFDLTVDVTDNLGSTILGVISGSGDFIKNGIGEIDFSSVNTTTGHMYINNGKISSFIDSENVIPAVSDISVGSLAEFGLYSGTSNVFQMQAAQTIKGTGNLGGMGQSIVLPAGTAIEPGFSPGVLTANSVSMQTGSQLNIELLGTAAGTEYDQLMVNDINLDANSSGGATLDLTVFFNPQLGDSFTIIKSNTAINGTFNGLSEGARFGSNDQYFTISYVGGGGNDVVLTFDTARYYVNANSIAPSDGLSWANAFTNLQDALAVAQVGDEIWVAQGVYYPDEGGTQVDDDSAATFNLIEGVSIYGGFDGTESLLFQRDILTNKTILSGDIEQNDTNIDGNFIAESVDDIVDNNSFHILTGSAVTTLAIIDGFTITAGQANSVSGDPLDKGAGMYCGADTSGPSINQLIFIGNYADSRGGGLYGCSQSINNTSFITNYSDETTGAMFAFGGEMNHVEFLGNSSRFSAGGLLNVALPLTVKNSIFEGNHAKQSDGGALYAKSDITLENILFKGNRAGDDNDDGGALFVLGTTTANLTNVTFTGNLTSEFGGAISISSTSTLNIQNSIIWNNSDSTGVGTSSASINISAGGVLNNSFSLIQGFGTTGNNNLDEDPRFVLDTDPSTAPTSIGDAHLTAVSPAIDAGNNSFGTELVDLDGSNRVINFFVDMGAYEFLAYSVNVTVEGLNSGTVILQNNGGDDLSFNSNSSQSFSALLTNTQSYSVTILSQPSSPNQNCVISNGSGVINNANAEVTVLCTTLQYNVGVDVSGLANGVTLNLLNNAETLDITSNGLSNFATALDDLSAYAVSITTQPSSPNQQCLIASNNASGNLNGANEVISIQCTTLQYTVGVDVSGLATGNSVVLDNNGEALTVMSDGQFNFATALDDTTPYIVMVTTQPTSPNQICSVVSASGTLQGADVVLTVACSTNQYLVGGMASGLAGGNSVVLSLGSEDLAVSSNAAFVFINPLTDETDYSVAVTAQPSVPNQTCDLVNPTGTIAGNDVTNMEVNCITNQYMIGGTVTGLHSGNNLMLQNNGGDDLTITSSGNFDFVTAIDDLQSYNATILNQASNPIQPCVISNNTGNVAGSNVTSVSIVCEFGDDLIYSGGFE